MRVDYIAASLLLLTAFAVSDDAGRSYWAFDPKPADPNKLSGDNHITHVELRKKCTSGTAMLK